MIESNSSSPLLSAEQLRQKAIRQADARGRKVAFKRMVWRYLSWITWSWLLPIVGSLTLLFILTLSILQGPSVAWNGFLQWSFGGGSINSAPATGAVKLDDSLTKPSIFFSDAKDIKLLTTDSALSSFSLELIKQEELEQQLEQNSDSAKSLDANIETVAPIATNIQAKENSQKRVEENKPVAAVKAKTNTNTEAKTKSNNAKPPEKNKTKETKENKNSKNASASNEKNK